MHSPRDNMKIIFVDGYNVINSWEELKGLSLADSRDKLINAMIDYAHFQDVKVSVVFDAHRIPGRSQHKEVESSVEVVYTKDSETADSYIERQVDGLGRKVEVQVVTSDNLEQQTIFSRGAQRMSSNEFRIHYHKVLHQIREKTKITSENKELKVSDSLNKELREKMEKMRRNG